MFERDLQRGRLRIGRGIDNDMRIEGRYVSRYHCCILTADDECALEDVHSTNGLFVNGQKVLDRYRLRDADVIQLGEHEIHYADLRRGSG
jgi:pSer/pThr/pTyr-binding forkhead associated (FHA) protein